MGMAPGWGAGDRERRRLDSFFLVGPRGSAEDSAFFSVSSHISAAVILSDALWAKRGEACGDGGSIHCC